MTKKVETKKVNDMVTPLKAPTYHFVGEAGAEEVQPSKRSIAKTMEVTENFNFYDVLKYVMQMEKAVEDKQGEIEGLNSMIKAYRDEIELIEKTFDITKMDEDYHKELHRKEVEKATQNMIAEEVNKDGDNEQNV